MKREMAEDEVFSNESAAEESLMYRRWSYLVEYQRSDIVLLYESNLR